MANNQYVNKVVYNGTTLMDVSGTTVAADKLLAGYTAIGPNGQPITGSLQQQSVNFTGVNVTADKLLKGYKAVAADGSIVEGTFDVDEILTKLTTLQTDMDTVKSRTSTINTNTSDLYKAKYKYPYQYSYIIECSEIVKSVYLLFTVGANGYLSMIVPKGENVSLGLMPDRITGNNADTYIKSLNFTSNGYFISSNQDTMTLEDIYFQDGFALRWSSGGNTNTPEYKDGLRIQLRTSKNPTSIQYYKHNDFNTCPSSISWTTAPINEGVWPGGSISIPGSNTGTVM